MIAVKWYKEVSMTNPKRDKVELIAHLMRRAGFGASPAEASDLTELPYDQIVQQLVFPNKSTWIGEHMVRRFDNEASGMINPQGSARRWLYRMITSDTPLIEKMPLFWHGIFATGVPKVINGRVLSDQIDMFRQNGMGRFDDLLLALAQDPAMIVWLDNQENNKDSINENWGRELLELFSMGVGNYTENDIKECARAFTGWSIGNTEYMMVRSRRDSDWPYGRIAYHFQYNPADHDQGEKTFLGETGNFNGEDIIRLICQQESTARFISRHLYHFFVKDEPPIPSWKEIPPNDEAAIEILVQSYFDNDHNISQMLVDLFNNPPSVEGWHEGPEWINTGTLVERINFVSEQFGDTETPRLKRIITEITTASHDNPPAEVLVQNCLDNFGFVSVHESTMLALTKYANEIEQPEQKISGLLRLIGTSKEYQLA